MNQAVYIIRMELLGLSKCFNETTFLVSPRGRFENDLYKVNYSEVLLIRPPMELIKSGLNS